MEQAALQANTQGGGQGGNGASPQAGATPAQNGAGPEGPGPEGEFPMAPGANGQNVPEGPPSPFAAQHTPRSLLDYGPQ
jgi:hypothetical protein